ncbi:hypothetical protein [Parapedobacter sp. 10938]|uniref:hypothetical protein n=1 Tax=Parapedobacter flavus TaxID=3110225 RepID=UPI002DB72AA0|nr:hypothetical protein [Parapedobacter sp. 10938]MEC3881804.1 hypothetical protein [Parapedobacter sp. 10938]
MENKEQLKMTDHPLEEQRTNQERFLAKLSEDDREVHALLFRVGNLTYRFHDDVACEPDEDDYQSWLEGLDEGVRPSLELMGFEKCRTMLALRLHASERSDRGYYNYLKKNLTPEDYTNWFKLTRREQS